MASLSLPIPVRQVGMRQPSAAGMLAQSRPTPCASSRARSKKVTSLSVACLSERVVTGFFSLHPTTLSGVARVFGVGSHRTDYDPDAHARALREIAAVEKRSPLIPFFADAAGFKARF